MKTIRFVLLEVWTLAFYRSIYHKVFVLMKWQPSKLLSTSVQTVSAPVANRYSNKSAWIALRRAFPCCSQPFTARRPVLVRCKREQRHSHDEVKQVSPCMFQQNIKYRSFLISSAKIERNSANAKQLLENLCEYLHICILTYPHTCIFSYLNMRKYSIIPTHPNISIYLHIYEYCYIFQRNDQLLRKAETLHSIVIYRL